MPINRTVVITKRGGPNVLALREGPLPEPRADEVRVGIASAGVGFADVLMREGMYPGIPPMPFTPGYDVAGIVDAVGVNVTDFRVGERVAALTVFGGYTDYACIPASSLVRIPHDLDNDEAVASILNFLTAYQMLHRWKRVRAGERVLIHGAGGGVGDALLQLGRLASLEMFGTASKEKHAAIAAYGATPIDYRQQDFVERIHALAHDGVDAVFDAVGGTQWRRSYQCLRQGGMLIGYGFSSATREGRAKLGSVARNWLGMPRFQLLGLMANNHLVAGYDVNKMSRARPDWYHEDLSLLLGLLAEKKIWPRIAARIPLAEAARAHELLGTSKVSGKIVLHCRGGDTPL